ncbi:MAG: hypothetical protein RIC55_09805 [Pirellulaceae bacterium]
MSFHAAKRLRFVVGASLLLLGCCTAVHGQTGAPNLAALAERGKQSLSKLDTDIFSWRSVHTSPSLPPHIVDTLHLPDMRRMTVSVRRGDAQQMLAQIYERDGYWYVIQGDISTKHHPYEALFDQPILYTFLAQSQLRSVDVDHPLGAYEGLEDNLALYRSRPTADEAARLAKVGAGMKQSLEGFRAQRKKANAEFAAKVKKAQEQIKNSKGGGGGKGEKGKNNKGAGLAADLRQAMIAHKAVEEQRDELEAMMQQQIETVADVRENGVLAKVDARSGVVMKWGIESQVEIRDIRRHDPSEIDASWFDVGLQNWLDMAPQRSESDYAQLAMFNHNPQWRPGGPSAASSAVLATTTGSPPVRVPYRGGIASGGCFSADRRHVYVTGQLVDRPAVGLFEIDLANGRQRPLGGETLQDGFAGSPSLSSDGKRLVVAHKKSLLEPQAQVYVIDIESGQARPIGEPLHASSPAWFPNDEALLIAVQQGEGASTIERLDFDGTLTLIQHGRSPRMLSPRRVILYDAGGDESHAWMTCNTDGRRAQPVGDGLADFAEPSPSTFGAEALMLRLGGEKGPRPHVVHLETGETREISLSLGWWSHPVWK